MNMTREEIKATLADEIPVHFHGADREPRLTPFQLKALERLHRDTSEYIQQIEAEKDALEYILTGVMHSVDKWLDVPPYDPKGKTVQDAVTRAAQAREIALKAIERAEALIPCWNNAATPPKKWKHNDAEQTLVNYLIYTPEYGVDVGNYIEPAKRWVIMGIPVKVTHWMQMPEPPEVTNEKSSQ